MTLCNNLICQTCGRDYRGHETDDDIFPGATCPAEDCPSTCDKCGATEGVEDFDNGGLWADVEALCPHCLAAAKAQIAAEL